MYNMLVHCCTDKLEITMCGHSIWRFMCGKSDVCAYHMHETCVSWPWLTGIYMHSPVLNVLSVIFHSNEFSKEYVVGTCLVWRNNCCCSHWITAKTRRTRRMLSLRPRGKMQLQRQLGVALRRYLEEAINQ